MGGFNEGGQSKRVSPRFAQRSGYRRLPPRRVWFYDQVTRMPLLQTPRLLLRSFTDADLDRMATLMADKEFMRF